VGGVQIGWPFRGDFEGREAMVLPDEEGRGAGCSLVGAEVLQGKEDKPGKMFVRDRGLSRATSTAVILAKSEANVALSGAGMNGLRAFANSDWQKIGTPNQHGLGRAGWLAGLV
jgi:hypothetical protein